ncbi:MAG: hypothetical protein K2V38_14855 [Gemmataceae bacterium]|nr:hypothetical protein [Gemmataceae bacterium]
MGGGDGADQFAERRRKKVVGEGIDRPAGVERHRQLPGRRVGGAFPVPLVLELGEQAGSITHGTRPSDLVPEVEHGRGQLPVLAGQLLAAPLDRAHPLFDRARRTGAG